MRLLQHVWIVMFLVLTGPAAQALGAEFVWIEGEVGKASVPPNIAGWGRQHFLSDEKWLHYSIEDAKVDKEVPGDGITIEYAFKLSKAARYEIWARIGFELVRSAAEWRIDAGPWTPSAPTELTTDLMDLALWCEVAWLKLGAQDLAAGDHKLEIRLPKTKNAQGKVQRILYAIDAVCVHEGPFQPNSKFKPGQTGRDAKDEEAARTIFSVPAAESGQRSAVVLKGLWEVARHDEQLPGEVAAPIRDLPEHPVWKAIPIPSDKNKSREDLIFAHRLWYRTRVDVPAGLAGRAFYVDFPSNNLNTTVYVNGQYCGFQKDPFCRFQIDITAGLKPGQVNEILVGIRDAWYGRSADPERPLKLRKTFNYPLEIFHRGFQDLDYPVWNCPQSGILCTPTLVAAGGAVYTSDVFVKPSVAGKQLQAQITVTNSGSQDAAGEIRWEAVSDASGQVEKQFTSKPFTVAAGRSHTLNIADAWPDPKLWWPDAPHLYRLRTSLAIGGRPVDVQETLFGFREWRIEGTKFTLNGIVWHMWADLIGRADTADQWLARYRATNQRTMRLMTAGQGGHDTRWMGMEPQEALEFMDRNGVVVRRNTTLDGEMIGSNFAENDPETRKKQGGSDMKLALMKNWRDQCAAQVKGERNHPSIQIWTIENEFAFINLINLLGNSERMDRYEVEIAKTHDAVRQVDPTRAVMIDGGGALKDNVLCTQGDHYVATLDVRYPDLAYEPFVEGGGRGRWKWDMQRPRFIGEDYFAAGINPADYAMWGGEIAFQGKAAARDAVSRCYRMLNEGYRWGGHYAAWHFWLGGETGTPEMWVSNAPRAVFVRQYDWTFGAGRKVLRTFGIFNDTQYPDTITFTRILTLGGKEVYTKTTTHQVKPGTAEKFDEELPVPTVDQRTEGELVLTLALDGKQVFRDTKAVSVLPPVRPASDIAPGTVAVFDPSGEASSFLAAMRVPFTPLATLENLPAQAKVLLVGRNAIAARDVASTRLAAYASAGHVVIVLDQDHPLRYQALPAEMELAERTKKNEFREDVPLDKGRTAFVEDTSHPALKGLRDKDFFTWGPDHVVYRNAYQKPSRGGKSLVQAGPRLAHTPLVEVPVSQGVIYLSQLDLGAKLGVNPVAGHLLMNLVRHAVEYKQEFAPVAAVIQDEQLAKALDGIGLQYAKPSDPLAALGDADKTIVVLSATPDCLKTLAGNLDKVQAFWQRGGTVVLCGLAPAGMADYNRVVGVEHVIRPFGRERVTLPAVRNPLTAGLSTGDVVLLSGKRIFGWLKDEFVVSDMFNYVVDLDEMAPFAKSDFPSYANIVNGFVGSDGWPLIIDFEFPQDGSPYEINLDLPREETVVEYTHDPSVNYNPTTRIGLVFDGRDRVEFPLEPTGDAQTFSISPPRKAKRVTLQLLQWQANPAKRPLFGIDNIYLKVQRSDAWKATVRPMLNVGGLVHYAKGPGGVVLCNLNFMDNEAVPVNVQKKRTILAAVLRNLKAPFAGAKTIIAGAGLEYRPLDIHTKATTYKDERGWFGDKRFTFKDLPSGEHVLSGVKYNIYEMPTSPVPQVLMLRGPRVPGNLPEEIRDIPVRAKADALFFLHAARIDRRLAPNEVAQKKRVEMFKYVVKYADGQAVEVPVCQEIDIEHFVQKEPRIIPGAQIAWMQKYEGSEESAVAYAKQWNNPRPEVEIASVDMVYGADRRGVPVLLAITAAGAAK